MTASDLPVVVIGSGMTGSLIATRLAEAGRRVVILESGPRRTLEQMYSSSIWARHLKWGGAPVDGSGSAAIATPYESGWGTGGGALHHYACWFRLHEGDFRRRSRDGFGRDWPIGYADLQPYYDSLQREIGLSGDHLRETWRPPGDPYPMPALPVFRQGALIAGGFETLGMAVAPLPMAINSTEYNERPACIQDGWCDAGCPTGALANPVVIYGRRLREAGVDIRHECTVSRIVTTADGGQVTGVHYHTAQGETVRLPAAMVVLAAFAVQTPRILLNSANAAHPAGLANSSGWVGRGLMAHGAISVFGMFDEATENHFGRTGGQLMSQDRYADGYGRACTWRIGPALKLTDLTGIGNSRPEIFGAALTGFMRRAATNLASMSALLESEPTDGARIGLSAQRDAFGVPIAALRYDLPPVTTAALEKAAAEGTRVMKAAGARDIWAGTHRTEHIMGGTVMGDDPADSVVDAFGKAHGIENLFIAGPSLFPSSGAVNPTFTAAALAARTADHILAVRAR